MSVPILRAMTQSIAHRGPDGEGIVVLPRDGGSAPCVGLGHRRLAIVDLTERASQPMTNEDETLWIILNGEIYNFQELRRGLERRGHPFRSSSDTEVILHLYEEQRERCVEELDGMFAFALWDAPRQRLMLARDRVGKKPLYYFQNESTFLFGSEVKALLQHPAVGRRLSLEALPHYFSFGYPPAGETFYQGIRQLPAAHVMTVDARGRTESRRYWRLAFPTSPGRRPAPTAALAEIRSLVTEAVRKRLVADVPVGAFLSGGVDSSIVVAVMRQATGGRVKTFSLGFTGDASLDETRYSRLVAARLGTDHTEFIVEPEAVELVESLVWHHDGPFGDSSAIPTSIIARLTRQHVTVALNGDGGDEVFAGYLRFQACLAAERLPPSLCRQAAKVLGLFPEPARYHHWLRRARRFFSVAADPLFTRLRRWVSIFDGDLHRLLRPEVFEGIRGDELEYPPEVTEEAAAFSTLSKVLHVNFATYLPEDLLVKMDRCTMAHSLEARSPFLDHRLVEYVAALPDELKLRRGTTKYILRAAFADALPPEILRRGKKGFGVPLAAWFRGELREYLHDVLLAPDARMRDYVQPDYAARLAREHAGGLRDHSHRLWALLVFEVWLRQIRHAAASLPVSPSEPGAAGVRLARKA